MDAELIPGILGDLLADTTPKEQFGALAGPQRLWWRHCQDIVRALTSKTTGLVRLSQLSADEERLRSLADDQASSEDDSRSFMASVHMTAQVVGILARQPGTAPSGNGEPESLVARYWARSGLLAPASPGTGQLPDDYLSAVEPSLREPIRSLARALTAADAGPSQAMVILTALRLAGVRPPQRHVTRVPVLFDKPDSTSGAAGVLEICELPGGPCGLYPDPEAMSFIRADEDFTGALASAWSYAIRGRTMNRCVLWRLTLDNETPILFIRGDSLGAALAVALREHSRQQPTLMRPWAPVRAAFLGLRPRCAITGALAPGDTLAAVGGMEAKLRAARTSNWRLVAPKVNQSAAVHVPDGLHVYWASTVRQASRYARRWRPVRTSLAAVTALALTGAGIAVRLDASAANGASAQRALAASVHAAAESETFDATDPATAARLAAAAWRLAPTAQARESLLQAYAQPRSALLPDSASAIGQGPEPAAFSPAGTTLVTATNEDVERWNTATHRQIGSPVHFSYGVCAVAYSPGGKLIAVTEDTGAVRLRDAATLHPVSPPMSAGISDYGPNCALSFSPDGKMLAAAGPGATIRMWDLRTYHQVGPPMTAGRNTNLEQVAFNPAGTVLAAANGNGTITTWNVATHARIGPPIRAPGDQGTVAFSHDGKILATAGNDLRFWSAATHREIGSPVTTGHGPANAVAFSPTEPVVATANADGTATLWDEVTHRQVGPVMATYGTGADASVTFSPDGKLLAATSTGITRLWSISLFDPTGSSLAASKRRAATDMAFSPDGTILATTGADGSARLWNPRTRRPLGPPLTGPGHHPLIGVAFSPDGATLALAGRDVQLWNVATRKPAGPGLPGVDPADYPVGPDIVAFSPQGTTLASVSSAGSGDQEYTVARLWNLDTYRQIGKPVDGGGSLSDVDAVAFSRDSPVFATGEDGQIAYLWNAQTRRRIGPGLPMGDGGGITQSVAFSPDGKTAATASGDEVQLWDAATQQPDGAAITAGDGGQAAIAFSPDGELLATADQDGTVRLWDIATHQQIGTTMTPSRTGGVNAVAFSPDGELLATADGDGAVQLIDVAFPHDLADAVCAIAARSLSPREWSTYIPTEPYQKIC